MEVAQLKTNILDKLSLPTSVRVARHQLKQLQVIAHCVYSNRNLYAFFMHIFSTPPDEADLVEATYLLLLDDKEVLKSLGFERRISRRDTRTSDDLVVLLKEKPI